MHLVAGRSNSHVNSDKLSERALSGNTGGLLSSLTFSLMTVTSNPSHHIKQTLRQQHECIGKRCTICKDLEKSHLVFVLSFYPMFHFLRVSSVTIQVEEAEALPMLVNVVARSSGGQDATEL